MRRAALSHGRRLPTSTAPLHCDRDFRRNHPPVRLEPFALTHRLGRLAPLLLAACGRTQLVVASASPDAGWIDGRSSMDTWATDAPVAPADAGARADATTCPEVGTVVRLDTTIRELDLVLLVESTGSMELEVNQLRAELDTEVLPALVARVPGLRAMGVAVSDYRPHGGPSPLRSSRAT